MEIEKLQNSIMNHMGSLDDSDIRFLNQILALIERYIKEKGRR